MRINSLKKVLTSISLAASLLMSQVSFAHIQEFAWNENIDGTIDFFGSSYHGSTSSALNSGLIIDGTAFNYTSYTTISNANWNNFLATEADGYQVIEDFAPVSGYGAFTLSLSDIADLGWVSGAQSFVASVFSSNASFVDVNGNGTEYVNDIVVSSVDVPAPGALVLFGLALTAIGLVRRKSA